MKISKNSKIGHVTNPETKPWLQMASLTYLIAGFFELLISI
jgi:hypothetical protein